MIDHPSSASVDAGLLNPGWAASVVAGMTSDHSFLKTLLDVEACWTEVLADVGMVSVEQAEAARSATDPASYDLVALAREAQGGGNPLIPVLKAMRSRVGSASTSLHMGATSQDIIDTALMVMSSRVSAAILTDIKTAVAALIDLARTHRETPMVARSLAQHSLPSTFGLRVAGWAAGLAQAGQHLEQASAQLPVQWGGAAGTMANLSGRVARAHRTGRLDAGITVFDLVDRLAEKLGLQAPPAPWDTNRLVVTRLGSALADTVVACGKIANDVLISARIENGELGEPLAEGRGGSSAMPHKQNPVLSVLIHSAALSAPGLLAQLYTGAGAANEERPDGAWHTEWPALRQLLRLAGGATQMTTELASGLRVHTDAMRHNLERTGPLLVSERIMAELAPVIDAAAGEAGAGKSRIQEVVDRSLAEGADFAVLLREITPDTVSDAELADLLDVAQYTGEAATLVDRLTAEYEEWSRA
ncbi:lyase family protein [Citricoccus sp. NR2]|uniref:lyase family protein n=1 Tax=Citricoccus sp. NR2 TaxID=3004095 RepID=UPI0022DDCB85|nr:lyase family protein [Citricoccus sp. NR2]WBL20160.1 lyase family protein [Citricoccus sp. NR2]